MPRSFHAQAMGLRFKTGVLNANLKHPTAIVSQASLLHIFLNMPSEITSSIQAFDLLKSYFNPYAEEIWVIALNSHLQVLGLEMIFRGTAGQCLVHPRDIFRFLIQRNASYFIMAHNHPSQEILPSPQDLTLTRKIYAAALLMQIPLHDHIVFGSEKYFSMADHGYFKNWKKSFQLQKYY